MNFIPETNLLILKNIPLDITYKNTITFPDEIAQRSYFSSKMKYSFTDFTYQRLERAVRVPVVADTLYDCNYIMFKNSNFGNKYFYAFITKIEYVNPNTTHIYFEIDVMQTWYFDYTLKYCYVEREHSATDAPGDNLKPENFGVGPYVSTGFRAISDKTTQIIIVGYVDYNEFSPIVNGAVYCGIYQGVKYKAFHSVLGIDALNAFINQITANGMAQAVVCMYQISQNVLPQTISGTQGIDIESTSQPMQNYVNLSARPSTLNGYTPRNKKLLTYPYCYKYVSSRSGSANIYRYELFSGTPKFYKISTFIQPVESKLVPVNYGNPDTGNVNSFNSDESVVTGNAPVCAWSFDSYNNYVNANRNSITWGLMNDTVIEPLSNAISSGNIIGGTIGAIAESASAAASLIAKTDDMKKIPATLKGSLATQTINAFESRFDFYEKDVTITAEYAKMIDSYFDKYGYATNENKIPNINTRESWNFIKTLNCIISGSLPCDDMEKIRNIYNSGITFWHGDYVGDYSRNNGVN